MVCHYIHKSVFYCSEILAGLADQLVPRESDVESNASESNVPESNAQNTNDGIVVINQSADDENSLDPGNSQREDLASDVEDRSIGSVSSNQALNAPGVSGMDPDSANDSNAIEIVDTSISQLYSPGPKLYDCHGTK